MNNKLGQNMMTADKVRELLNKANIPTTPTYMGPSLPQAPKGNKLGKAASSIGKSLIGTLPILTQTACSIRQGFNSTARRYRFPHRKNESSHSTD